MSGKDREERKLKKAKIALMHNPKFALYSGIMMLGKTSVVDGFPTAMTNGRDEIYGREFIRDLGDRELAFVILHENLHKAYRHLTTWAKLFEIDPRLCNQACDYVINLQLHNMDRQEKFIRMPRKPDGTLIGLLDTRFAKMHTKQVFDILRKEQEDGGGDGGDDNGGGGFDEHDWAGAKELSDEEREKLEREVDQALRQGQIAAKRLAGQGAGDMSLEIGELLRPKVDWRAALREFVTSVCASKDTSSWRRPNRRFLSMDIIMPSLIGERIGPVAIGVDTSGSALGLLSKFMSEAKSVFEDVQPEKVHLIYWDWVVAGHETYDAADLPNALSVTKPAGGGGTDPTCMEKYLKEQNIKPECIIMFTDGEVPSWGTDWPAPVLWVICNEYNRDIVAGNGKTIHIED